MGLIRVGRWMLSEELNLMISTGLVQESRSGTTHVAWPADRYAFYAQAEIGALYVEFDVTEESVRATQHGWAKILGPNSLEGRLAVKKGGSVPKMPAVLNVVHIETK
jgi:hypothetical protein